MSVNTQSKLYKIDLIRQIPISKPILNCIKVSARSPDTVVNELDAISGIDFERAFTTASLWSYSCLSSL